MSKRTKTIDGEPAPRLYLQLVTDTSSHGYFRMFTRVISERYEHGARVPYGPNDTYGDGLLFSGLRASCQGDDDSALKDGAPVYGMDVDYHDTYSVDLRKCKRMLKTLTHVDRGLEKLREKRGHVGSWGEFVGRLAEVLGCEGVCIQKTAEAENRSGYRWSWETVGEGVNTANRLVYDWRRPYLERAKGTRWEVVVGNVGTVHSGPIADDAMKAYRDAVDSSKAEYGRAAGEPVTLMKDGEIWQEYAGTLAADETDGAPVAPIDSRD